MVRYLFYNTVLLDPVANKYVRYFDKPEFLVEC